LVSNDLLAMLDTESETAKNIRKREVAITQLTHVRDAIGTTIPSIKGIVIGGDFNTNYDQGMFAEERTLGSLATAGYENGFEGLALTERVTHPSNHGFPDATFDYVFAKGLTAMQPSIFRTTASDHWPVTRDFRLH
jgi:endonuclease/exonuclease/phosphatase (EEP) superfamily protein YafD